jgi:hypothetical protein
MAIVDVSRIPNNNKFDPVREAILELEGLLTGGFAGVTSINGQTNDVNIVAGDNITVAAVNGVITISSTASGGVTSINSQTGSVTLEAGDNITITNPSSGVVRIESTASQANVGDGNLLLVAGGGIKTLDSSTYEEEVLTWGTQSRIWVNEEKNIFSANSFDDVTFTIEHADTSSVTDKTNTGGNVIQTMTFDTYGHVRTAEYTDLDNRYLAFRTIQTNNDNQQVTATVYNDIVEFEGGGSISVTKSPVSNEIRFGLALNDIRFEDGKRVARGFLYWQSNVEPTDSDRPTASTFDFTKGYININDSDWAQTPPFTGYPLTTYYIVRFTSIDEGGTGEEARPVSYSSVTEAVGFEGPVSFNSLAEELGGNGLTIIDGGRIRTGIITSLGVERVGIDAGTSFFTERGSYFELETGDIATTEFSVLDGNARFKGDVTGASGTFGAVDFNKNGYLINASGFQLDLNGNVTIGGSKFVIPIYADDSSGTNRSFTQNGREFVLFYNSDVPQSEVDINTVTGTWIRFIGTDGVDGVDGEQGPTGPEGPAGSDGVDGINGTDGVDGSNGLKTATGLVFYQFGAISAPSTPTASYFNFSTGQFVGLTTGWSEDTPLMEAGTSTNQYYSSYYTVTETSAGSNIGSVTFTTPTRSFAFNQVVTFSSLETSGSTIINGDNITTGIIASSDYVSQSGSVFSADGMAINLNSLSIETPSFAIDGNGDAYFSSGDIAIGSNKITLKAPNYFSSVGEIEFLNPSGNLCANMRVSSNVINELTLASYVASTTKGNQLILSSERFYLGRSNGSFIEEDSGNFLRLFGASGIKMISLPTIATSANMYIDSVTGTVYRATSSLRYKKDVEDYTRGIEDLKKLRPVSFKSINEYEGATYAGFIAEEVHEAGLTEYVDYNERNEPDAIHYSNLVTLLTKAVQEQQDQIELLKSEIDALKNNTAS